MSNNIHIDDKSEPSNKLALMGFILGLLSALCIIGTCFSQLFISSEKHKPFESLYPQFIIIGIIGISATIISLKTYYKKKTRLSQLGIVYGIIGLVGALTFLVPIIWVKITG